MNRVVVVRHDKEIITLAPAGSLARKLGSTRSEFNVVRTGIVTTRTTRSEIVITLSDGSTLNVERGNTQRQQKLVSEAFKGLI